ncbi:MAG: hypothetical protein N2043_02080 [Ignavibacterium sp.]|nr:hypothetical protein [Ignavibacterium sp.]
MARRVKLSIDVSGLNEKDVTWNVYRSTSIDDILNEKNFIMKVKEKEAIKQTKYFKEDILSKNPDDTFSFFSTYIYLNEPEKPKVYINDELIDESQIIFFEDSKEIRIIDSRLTLNHNHIIKMSYYYKSIDVFDDNREQIGVEYNTKQKPATGLKKITNTKQTVDVENNTNTVSWEHDESGFDYYYQIFGKINDTKSPDSEIKSIYIEQNEIKYLVQKSTSPHEKEENWEDVGIFSEKEIVVNDFIADLPFWCEKNEVELIKINDSQVKIRVPNPFKRKNERFTWCYRIAPIDDCGVMGDFEYCFPIPFENILKVAKVRRYRYNKIPSSFDGIDDGIDIVVWDDKNISDEDYLEYIDTYIDIYDEEIPKEFGYTFYIRDKWNMISKPIYKAINIKTGEIIE